MDSTAHVRFNASERSYFAILKREIHQIVSGIGFSEGRVGEVDIIVAEMASNLVKHAGGGEILVKVISENDNIGVEIISIDNGPGMADPMKMLEDGMSTANTLGHGLGAIKRLSSIFQAYSVRDWGTIILSRVFKEPLPLFIKKNAVEVRSVVVPIQGEKLCGDGEYYHVDNERLLLFLGDGLGHGPHAHDAVQEAIKVLKNTGERSPADMLRAMHPQVKKTRGLVAAIALYNFKQKKWNICGIGNIATRMQQGLVTKNHMAYNGVIGMNIPNTINEQIVDGERGQIVIMCSDGIRTRWDIQKYVGIFKYDLSILAAAIYKDFARHTDDMSVVVGRINNVS